MYGSRHGKEVRVAALHTPFHSDEEQEKVGVYVSRIRGEVFLTEADLAVLNEHQAELALVVAGNRAGFFVREADGSIQTVRSHEEFWVSIPEPELPPPLSEAPPVPRHSSEVAPGQWHKWVPVRWVPASWFPKGLVAMAALPLVALGAFAVFPQWSLHAPGQDPASIEISEIDNQLRISWKPGQNAVLTIDDSGGQVSIPVYPNQSSATYGRRGADVQVRLDSVDAANRPRRLSTRYVEIRPVP